MKVSKSKAPIAIVVALILVLLLGYFLKLSVYDVSYVDVKVKDSAGNPAPNVFVEATCEDGQANSGYTNKYGEWTTSFLGPVICTVTVRSGDYSDSDTKYINVMETGYFTFTVPSAPTGVELTVIVHDAGFPAETPTQAVVYALVEVDGKSEYTNEDGIVSFSLETGTYTIRVSKERYETQTKTISLTESKSVTFTLTKLRPRFEAVINVPAIVKADSSNDASVTIQNKGDTEGVLVERELEARNTVDGQTRPLWSSTETLTIGAGDSESFTAKFYAGDWYHNEKWMVSLSVRDAEEGWFYNIGVGSFTTDNPDKIRPSGATKTRWVDPNEGQIISGEYTFIFKIESGEISEGIGITVILAGSAPENLQCYGTFTMSQAEENVWNATYDTTKLVNGQYKLSAVFEGYDYDLPGYVEQTNTIYIYINNVPWWEEYLPFIVVGAIVVGLTVAIYATRRKPVRRKTIRV